MHRRGQSRKRSLTCRAIKFAWSSNANRLLPAGNHSADVGPYERLLGMASFAIDPNENDLPFICDLEFAPRNPEGLVEFKTVLDIVKPVDLSRGNRKLLFDFSNRGGRGAFTRLNDGGGADLTKESYAGNGFLNRHGYTVVCAGWQGDLVYSGNNVVAFLPEARQNGQPLRGRVRQEFISDRSRRAFDARERRGKYSILSRA